MELIANNTQVIPREQVVNNVSKGNFIEAKRIGREAQAGGV